MPDRRRALIIDDDPQQCELLTAWLSDRFLISSAYDGETGIELAQRERPDIILLDVMLPKLSGFSLAWVFKHDPYYADCSVIFLTGVNVNERALSKVDGYLQKPVRREELTALIDRALSRRRALPAPLLAARPAEAAKGIGRRRAPRVDVEIPATLEVSGRVMSGSILQLSPWGVFFATAEPIPFESSARVRFGAGAGEHFDFESFPLYRSAHRGNSGIGLRIRAAELDSEQRLSTFIERHLPSPAVPGALETLPS